jgi:hypothetical protein
MCSGQSVSVLILYRALTFQMAQKRQADQIGPSFRNEWLEKSGQVIITFAEKVLNKDDDVVLESRGNTAVIVRLLQRYVQGLLPLWVGSSRLMGVPRTAPIAANQTTTKTETHNRCPPQEEMNFQIMALFKKRSYKNTVNCTKF